MADYIEPSEPKITLDDVGGSALGFAEKNEAPITDAMNQYVMTARSQAKPLDIFTQLEGAAGLPEMKKTASTLRGQVYDLEDSIKNVKKNVQARSTQSIVTNAQAAGMTDAYRRPMIENLTELGTGLGRVESAIQSAGSDVAAKTGLVLQGNQQELDVFKTQMDVMSDRAARLMTGFSTDQQNRLNILMDRLNRGRQLSDIERAEAFELSKMEKQFNMQKEQFGYELSANAAANPQRTTISLGNNKTALIDPISGKVIQTYGGTGGGGAKSGAAAYLPTKSGGWS